MAVCQVTGSKTTRGNNVPKSNQKTKRTIKNSTANRTFFSKILGLGVSLKCTKRASDIIIRAGGIDCYVINEKSSCLMNDIKILKKRMEKAIIKKNISNLTPEQIQFM